MAEKIWTPLELVKVTADYLEAKGVCEARLSAEMLLAHVLGVERIALYTRFDEPLERAEVDAFRQLVRRRAAREPTQYILGRTEFYGLEIALDSGVLIPRPETEMLVDCVREFLADRPEARVADICTGSGAVALAVAAGAQRARVWATDTSEKALRTALENARRLGVADGITFLRGDLCGPLEGEDFAGTFDAVLANPPYVGADEWERLAPEVRDYEPRDALVPPDGRAGSLYPALTRGAARLLKPGGLAAFEIDPQLAEDVASRMAEAHLRDVRVIKDFRGDDRVVAALKMNEGDSDG